MKRRGKNANRPEYWAMDAEEVIRMGAETTRPFL